MPEAVEDSDETYESGTDAGDVREDEGEVEHFLRRCRSLLSSRAISSYRGA